MRHFTSQSVGVYHVLGFTLCIVYSGQSPTPNYRGRDEVCEGRARPYFVCMEKSVEWALMTLSHTKFGDALDPCRYSTLAGIYGRENQSDVPLLKATPRSSRNHLSIGQTIHATRNWGLLIIHLVHPMLASRIKKAELGPLRNPCQPWNFPSRASSGWVLADRISSWTSRLLGTLILCASDEPDNYKAWSQ